VSRKVGDTREAARVADTRKGLGVSADSGGYPVVESYPSQTRALAVEILEPSWPYDEGCEGDTRNRNVWLGRGMPIVHFVP
jgi:hypothetical protein